MIQAIVGAAVFVCCLGAALTGLLLHKRLPDHHLDGESKEVIKLVMGLIGTMSALVLGLLIASAQSSYNSQAGSLHKLAADVVHLDHLLALYGPETQHARELLRQDVTLAYEMAWSPHGVQTSKLNPSAMRAQADQFYDALQDLTPATDRQRFAHSEALQVATVIAQTRTLMYQQARGLIAWPFLVILVFWVSTLFLGFGLLARTHATTVAALVVGSLSVAAAIFLILELGSPYGGLIRLPSEPIREALTQLG